LNLFHRRGRTQQFPSERESPKPSGQHGDWLQEYKMNMKHLIGALSMCAASMTTPSVDAAILRFTITGNYSAMWDLNSSTVPSFYQSGAGFAVWNAAGTFSGAVQNEADVTFYNAAVGGGLNIYDVQGDLNLLAADGPQLYTGPESRLGSFSLTQFHGAGAYKLTVADVSAIPEPASAALVLAGLSVLYAIGRVRRSRTSHRSVQEPLPGRSK
jgi:hypothetical protein